MPSNHLILCCPFLLPSIFPSIRIFSNESQFPIRWPKCWSFNFSISFPMSIQDWFPLGWTGWVSLHPRDSQESSPTPQFKSINSLALSFLYSPTLTSIHDYRKTIALTKWTFVGKVMSLLFNVLSRLVTTFFSRSKHLLISWLQLSSAVIFESRKINSLSFHYFPLYLPWSDGTRCHDHSFLNDEFSANFFILLFHFHQEAF